ncbi:DUF4345 family protein [Stenotrophobium rhamnosiphilum]|uniref:DUF4345 domain-containing protein n=1 Tax=Stenotrophobium rhamnosiphilum TaxID=2029166 RepID=A0A2T5MBY4_9GAMM|nr:DUF4345 family protein [Stenotrophobium rhamnosiphilum]PTU30084.1 hypothetical protein CJD38_16180 [Stenotrophobium rhamnosiphilum]
MFFYLVITGALFLIVGLRALFRPVEAIAVPYSLSAKSIDAKNYLRSGAGGVAIAAGAVMVASAFIPSLTLAGVLISMTILGGLVFGRVVSLLLDGNPGITPWISGFFELLGFLSGAYWLQFYLS